MSFLEKLRSQSLEGERPADPWLAPLQRVRGKVEFDGQERVSSQTVLDVLEVPQRQTHSGDVPAPGEVDGGVGLDGRACPRPHARRLQGAGARVRAPRFHFKPLVKNGAAEWSFGLSARARRAVYGQRDFISAEPKCRARITAAVTNRQLSQTALAAALTDGVATVIGLSPVTILHQI